MAYVELAARDFHAISSTFVTILIDAVRAINALSLHLHGALGPGFDPEKVCDSNCVEDLLSAPMKRCLSCRRLFTTFTIATFHVLFV
jgi:hypothetical protein